MTKHKPQKLTPAELVVARFGGVRVLGRLLECDPSAISKWITRGGQIPIGRVNKNTHRTLLKLAKQNDVKLSAEELVLGGEA